MRSYVDAKAFSEALNKVSIVLKKTGIPALDEVTVHFTESTCKLVATDLNIWITAELPANGDTFSFTLSNTKNIAKACRYYSGSLLIDVRSVENDLRLTLRCSEKSGTFPVLSAEDSPVLSEDTIRKTYSINTGNLLNRVKRIKYASIVRSDKPVLSGVCFKDTKIWCVDGYRLAVSNDPALQVEKPFILPVEAMQYLQIFDKEDATLQIGAKYAIFKTGGLSLHTRLMDQGSQIDLEKVWPQQSRERNVVHRAELLDAIKYLKEFPTKSEKPYVYFRDGILTLHTNSGVYRAEIKVDGPCEVDFAFDLRYMKEALEQFSGSDYLTLSVSNPFAPILLTEDGNGALILPVRIKEEWRKQAA